MASESRRLTWGELCDRENRTDEYIEYSRLAKLRRQHLGSLDIPVRKTLRVALLSAANTDFLPDLLELAFESCGLRAEILKTAYNTYAYQMMNADSEACRFAPDLALLVLSPFNQPAWPDAAMDEAAVEKLAAATARYWLDLCAVMHGHTGCEIIVDNLHSLPWRPHGSYGVRLPIDDNGYLDRINRVLASTAPEYMHIHDVAGLAVQYGTAHWVDLKYWHHAKLSVSFDCLVPYVRTKARLAAAVYGGSHKVLVLDLDNTLWGGVIGDDGLDGIRVGQGTPEGEAFTAFQRYVFQLKQRGVLLAVCSKNEVENAELPFREHGEMLLKLDDFAAFIANWQPKTDNLISMAQQLNLGLDAFVFVDDNPAERELMRSQLPQVLTIELGDDPAQYPGILDRAAAFETTGFSNEDRHRTEQYRQNAARESLRSNVADYDAYVASLAQRAQLAAFDAARLDRITQLINKTNQFNLTTERLTRSEVEAMLDDDARLTLTVQLLDRFGDNGVVVALYGSIGEDCIDINGWLMSCRVFKRGVEYMVCNHVVEQARALGKRYLRGLYTPTPKNAIVSTLYGELGFDFISSAADGATRWQLDVTTYQLIAHHIEVEG